MIVLVWHPNRKKLPAIYGENLALICALEKCKYWLPGGPQFVVRTDHQALCSLYNNKNLDEIPKEIEDILIKTFRYNFRVEYVPGKDNCISDYLSRNPVWRKSSEEGAYVTNDFGYEIPIEQYVNAAQTLSLIHI